MVRAALVVAGILFASACATVGPPQMRIAAMPAGWEQVKSGDGAFAWHHTRGGTIAASESCGPQAVDAPLDVLTNHLLMGFSNRKEESRKRFTLDGREALRTRMSAALDGVVVELDLVVVKKDGCNYDFSLVGEKREVDERRGDFDALLASFRGRAS